MEQLTDIQLTRESGQFSHCQIPLPPDANWLHRFYNNMTAQEHGPWILRLTGFDQVISSQDVVIIGNEADNCYFLAGTLSAERSTTHLFAHYEFGRFTRLGIWQPELNDNDSPEPMLFLQGSNWRDLITEYWEQVLAHHNLGNRRFSHQPPLTGYCSWYYYYDDLSENQFLANLEAVVAHQDQFPVRFMQIDDGYQTFHGDWLEQNERWPTPLSETISKVRAQGMETGVWLMPFLASAQSRVAREHPEWFVKDEKGEPVHVPGWSNPPNHNWQCLDTTNPQALAYIRHVFHSFREMGVTYFKLDGVGFAGQRGYRHDPHATGSSAFRLGLQAIREAADEAWILGCGGNYLAGLGVYDSVRVSCDTAIDYEPRGLPNKPASCPPLPMRHPSPALPGLENAVRATLFNWWRFDAGYRCDPDVLIARDNWTHLTEGQARMSVLTGILTGVVFTSDKLDECSNQRLQLLALAAKLRMTEIRPYRVEADGSLEVFTGKIDDTPALAFFNFSTDPKNYSVEWSEIFAGNNEELINAFDGARIERHTNAITVAGQTGSLVGLKEILSST